MTQAPQPRFIGPPSGFFAVGGDRLPLGNVPAKVGFRRRVRPECEIRLDAWLLQPTTLRQIAADLGARSKAAGQARHLGRPDEPLAAAAEALADFINARRLFGERPGPWS